MTNPYNVGNWVRRPHFYGRTALTAEALREDRQSIYLMGTRRVGKTSLLREIEACSGAPALYINLQSAAAGASGRLDRTRVVRLIKRELGRQSQQQPVLAQVLDRIHETNLAEAMQELKEGAEDYGVSVCILWDEAEKLLDLDRGELESLRSSLQDSSAIRTILAATKGLSELNDRGRSWGTSPFLFGFVTMPISILADEEAAALVAQRDHPDGLVRTNEQQTAEIIHVCGNHPFLIQYLCERLYQPNRSLRRIEEQDLVVDDMLAALFAVDFAQLSESEQVLLRLLGKVGPRTAAQLRRATGIGEKALASFLEGLKQLGFIRGTAISYEPGSIFLANWLNILPPGDQHPHVSDQASLEVVDEDRQHMQGLRATYKRRLHALELQAAQTGIYVEAAVSNEINDLRAKIQQLSDQLGIATP